VKGMLPEHQLFKT